ncbi:antibiotic biosynthesis monooxygenase [Paenibacillus pasadenensis]|uniref:antibiotic biosynthesis monooxygenase n=1 Tax=Paenibacillus pasadenensis TaxID=217090 RepID=UPI00333FBB50
MLVENRIVVKAGFAEAVLERFAKPKTVHTFPGFIRMDVLHGKVSDAEEEIRVCTTWQSKADFEAWASSDSFRGAHARRQEASAENEGAASGGQAEGSHGGSQQSSGAASGHGHGHGGPHGRPAAGSEGAGPIVGNKVTIYRVAASHLPETEAAEQA